MPAPDWIFWNRNAAADMITASIHTVTNMANIPTAMPKKNIITTIK